jgi:hypothetical protein
MIQPGIALAALAVASAATAFGEVEGFALTQLLIISYFLESKFLGQIFHFL